MVDLTEYVDEMSFSMPRQTKTRIYHLRQFSYPAPGGEWMNQITMESHISSHIEGRRHVVDANENRPGVGKDLAVIPLEKFYGEAILIKIDKLSDGSPITVEWLASLPIKMIAFDRSTLAGLENRPKINDPKKTPQPVNGKFAAMKAHQIFLGDKSGKNIILIIEIISHLDKLIKKKVLHYSFASTAWRPRCFSS